MVCAALFVTGRNLYRRYVDNALMSAVEQNDVGRVRALLNRGADPNTARVAEGVRDIPALEIAVLKSEPIACLLVEHGANVHQKPGSYPTYLGGACENGQVALARCLLEHGADVNAADANRQKALTRALRYGQLIKQWQTGNGLPPLPPTEQARRLEILRQMFALLRQHGAKIALPEAVQMEDAALMRQLLASGANVNEKDDNGRTALEWAMRTKNPLLMQTLLARGANPNAAASIGGTLLNMAAQSGGLDAARLLLAHGAKVNPDNKQYPSPLTSAAEGKNLDVARLLLAHGANPNAAPGEYQPEATPLAAAAEYLPALIPDLLAHHADINGNEGLPLRAALRAHDPATMRYLLQHGAKIQPPISKTVLKFASLARFEDAKKEPTVETTPSTLHVAVTNAPECFDPLMQAGADITPDKRDILLAAASAGHALLFDRLISLGANVNAADEHGRTPLTEAISHAPDGVKTLLEHGANPNIVIQPEQQQAWQTPLIMAVQTINADLVRLLLAHGANVNVKPPRSHTALYFARRHKKPDAAIVRLLEQAGANDE